MRQENLKHQQNLANRRIAIVVLTATSWPRIQMVLQSLVEAVSSIKPSGYIEVTVPYGS